MPYQDKRPPLNKKFVFSNFPRVTLTNDILKKSFEKLDHTRDGWVTICDALANEFGGVGTAIFPVNKNLRPAKIVQSKRLDRVAQAYMEGGWFLRDVRERGLEKARRAGYTTDMDFITEAEFRTLPYYKNFLRPNGIGGFLAIIFKINGSEWVASIQLPKGMISPDPDKLRLVKPIKKILELHAEKTLHKNHMRWLDVSNGFDLMHIGLLAVNTHGKIQLANATAESLIIKYRLKKSVNLLGEDEELLRMQSSVFNHEDNIGLRRTLAKSEKFELLADFSLPTSDLDLLNAKLIYFAKASEIFSKKYMLDMYITRNYKMTKREISIVNLVVEGVKTRDISNRLEISEGNVRQHLKRIFRKVGVTSQTQLAAAILREI